MIFKLFCMRIPKVTDFGWPPKFLQFAENSVFLSVQMDAEWLWIGCKLYIRTFRCPIISLFREKGYKNWCSQSFSHPCTNQALRCLTSMMERELMRSTWYGCTRWHLKQNCFRIWQHSFIHYRFTILQSSFLSSVSFRSWSSRLKITWFAFAALGSRQILLFAFKENS